MRKVYWQPQSPSRAVLVLVAFFSIGVLAAVEKFPVNARQPWYDEKLAASRLALEAFGLVKNERLARGIAIDSEADPQQTGLIGRAFSPVTSNTGSLTAKRASTNPNFAGLIVDWLKRAGVEKRDSVAVAVSGSFPALCISTYAAIQVLELEPIVVASASASEWGANEPSFMWLDMDKLLYEKRVFRFRSKAASRGGIDDYGSAMSKESLELIDRAIERSAVERLDAQSLADGIELRMKLYDSRAGDRPIKAYINVGGGTASVGTHVGKKQFKPGLNSEPPTGAGVVDSVMLRFANRGVPVIHVTAIEDIAKKHGFSWEGAAAPRVGEGTIYVKQEYNRWIAIAGLAAVLASMLALLRLDLGARLLANGLRRKDRASSPPEQTV